jgi:hypothetical protein
MTTLVPKFDFKDGGTTPIGAVNRSIQEKLGDFVSATDFGMVNTTGNYDPATNKTALQAAIDSLGTAGGTIYIPNGTYFVDPGIVIAHTKKCISIIGAGSGIAYDDNEGGTTLKFSSQPISGTSAIGFTGADGSAGPYAKLSNLYLVGSSQVDYGIIINGNVELDHVVCSYFNVAGVWLKSWINSTLLNHVTCVNNITFGMLIGVGSVVASGSANTVLNVTNSTFRGNLVGVRCEQAQGYSFHNCVFESNKHEGLVLYQWNDATGASPNNNGLFDTCYFEANSTTDDVHPNLLSDAGTRSINTLNTPSNMLFLNCLFVSYMTGTATVSKPNIYIDCGNNFEFRNCLVITGGPASSLSYTSPIFLNTYTSNINFYNIIGNPTYTNSGTINSNATNINGYYEQGTITMSLRDTDNGGTVIGTGTAYYTINGNAVTLDLPSLSGTSGNVNKVITGLPSSLYPVNTKLFPIVGYVGASTPFNGYANLDSGGTFTLYSDGAGTVWSATGGIVVNGPSISYTLT